MSKHLMLKHFPTSILEESRIKVVIVGDSGVGKTTFLVNYCSNTTTIEESNSIFNNFIAHMNYMDKIVKIDFWELPSSEEYLKMREINYPKSDAFFIFYSIDNESSLQNALTLWYPEIKINNYENNPVIFIGTKTDIRDVRVETPSNGSEIKKSHLLSKKEAQEIITKKLGNEILIFECSALVKIGINELLIETLKEIFDKRDKNTTTKRENCCVLI